MISIFNFKKEEKGQAIVEYALVLPIFLLILMFIIDVGWIGYQKVIFDYTCRNSVWDLRIARDETWVMNEGEQIIRSGQYANDLLSAQFKKVDENTSNSIDMDKVSISHGQISMYPGEKEYKYKKPEDTEEGVVVYTDFKYKTVTVEIEGKIEYQIELLTPLTKPFFKDGIKLTNNVYKAKKGAMRTVQWPT